MSELPRHRPALLRGLHRPLLGAAVLVTAAWVTRGALLSASRAPAALTLLAELLALAGLGRLVAAIARVSARARLMRDERSVSLDADAMRIEGGAFVPLFVSRRRVTRIIVAGPDSFPQVHVATRSPAHPVVSFPVRTGHSAQDLHQRLLAWQVSDRETENEPLAGVSREPGTQPLQRYDNAARGRLLPGDCVLPSSRRWLARGPWFALVLVIALSLALARRGVHLGALLRTGTVGYLAAAAVFGVVVVSAGWVVLRLRSLGPRRGLAALLTPEELITRQRGGVRRIAWKYVEDVSLRREARWTPLLGRLERAAIMIRGGDQRCIELPADELGWPVERALVAIDAYRAGLPPTAVFDSVG